MNQLNYISIHTAIGDVRREIKKEIEEDDIIEWIGKVLEQTQATNDYDEYVAFQEVRNYETPIPPHARFIVQVARDYCWDDNPEVDTCPATVVPEEPTADYVVTDCKGRPLTDYELRYYTPSWDFQFEYYGWTQNQKYQQCFRPVRLANNSFFHSVVAKELDQTPYQFSSDEYSVFSPNLRFNFKDGFVAIAYGKQRLDEDGYPMIPDATPYREAIVAYIRLKLAQIDLDLGVAGGLSKKREAERDWQWYCKQATNYSKMLKGPDDYQDMSSSMKYILPNNYRYFEFFGGLGTPENRAWHRTHQHRLW